MDVVLLLGMGVACMLAAWLLLFRRKSVSGKLPPILEEGFSFWTGHIGFLLGGGLPKEEILPRIIKMVEDCPHGVSAIYPMGPSWLTQPMYMVKDAELMATTLAKGARFQAFLRGAREIIGEKSIPALSGAELKRHRRILTSSILLRKALARLTEIVSRNTHDCLATLTTAAAAATDGDVAAGRKDTPTTSPSSSFELDLATANTLGMLVVDSLGSFAFGMDIARSAGGDAAQLRALHESLEVLFDAFDRRIRGPDGALRLLSYLAVGDNLRVRRARAFVRRSFILPAVARRKAAVARGDDDLPDDALTMMLAAGEGDGGDGGGGGGFSDDEICDEAMLMIIGGYETTNASLLWVIYHLAKRPEEQELCFAEANAVMAGNAPGSLPTIGDIDRLSYLQRVIQESQRLTPPIPVISRYFEEDFQLGDYVIPGGSKVTAVPTACAKSEDMFDRAAEFLPSRWQDDPTGGAKLPGASFLPFGLGKLRCFGQPIAVCSMKAILATWVRCYRFELISNPEPGARFTVVMKPKSLRIRMTKRQ